jgi:hypothetical protein
MNNRRMIARSMRHVALALMTLAISTGCVNTQDSAAADGPTKMRAIVLPAPDDVELSALRGGGKGEPYRVGAGRPVPVAESRIALSTLPWTKDAAGAYKTEISIQSVGARSIRVGLRLNVGVPNLELAFDGSSGILRGDNIVSATSKDLFWSPVLNGDTVKISLTTSTLPKSNAVLEVPLVSHIP